MNKRLVYLGLVVAVSQLFATGCCPIARWRANHPYGLCGHCGPCTAYHPLLHPVQTRRAVMVGPVATGPVITSPPCHGCGASTFVPGAPVSFDGPSGSVVPVNGPTGYPLNGPTGYPPIGYPIPISPGPMVVPSYELPAPMPVKPPVNY